MRLFKKKCRDCRLDHPENQTQSEEVQAYDFLETINGKTLNAFTKLVIKATELKCHKNEKIIKSISY